MKFDSKYYINKGEEIMNYIIDYLLPNIKVGSKIRKNYGAGKMSNQIFLVTEITETTITAECCEVIRPSISQGRNLKKLLSEKIVIEIDKGGSFPRYAVFTA